MITTSEIAPSPVLNTLIFRGYSDLPKQNLYTNIRLQFTQPTIKLTYTRSFGKDKLKEKESVQQALKKKEAGFNNEIESRNCFKT